MAEGGRVRHPHHQAHLRGLDQPQHGLLEVHPAGVRPHPIQQYGYTTGKNSTDSAMIIDAMDILYSGNCDGFVLVSSDSDFTRLAIRLREAGMKVYGMGEKENPQALHRGLRQVRLYRGHPGRRQTGRRPAVRGRAVQSGRQGQKHASKKESKKSAANNSGIPDDIAELIAESVEDVCGEDGYAHMGKLGNLLLKKQPDFDPPELRLLQAVPS